MKIKPMNDLSVSMELRFSPKLHKELIALGFGYARPSGIKRTRKRAIEKAKLMTMTPIQKKNYKYQKVMASAFSRIGKAADELGTQVKNNETD